MAYDPNIHHRRSIRMKGYDYSQAGLYFITICVQNRNCLFGEIVYDRMKLNDAGRMLESEWLKLPEHFHAILEIAGATLVVAQNNDGTRKQNGQPQGIAPTEQNAPTVEYIRCVKHWVGHVLMENCGNVIIGNTLFVTKNHLKQYQPIS